MRFSRLPPADHGGTSFQTSTFQELLADEPLFDFSSWSASMPESFLQDFFPKSPTPGIHNDREAPTSPTSSNDTSTAASPPVSSRMSVSMKAKRYRRRKRAEMDRLRDTVKTLEVRLAALQARPAPVEATLGPFAPMWEAVAVEESASRQEAERENMELRETIAMHLQLACKLDQVLSKIGVEGCSEESF